MLRSNSLASNRFELLACVTVPLGLRYTYEVSPDSTSSTLLASLCAL